MTLSSSEQYAHSSSEQDAHGRIGAAGIDQIDALHLDPERIVIGDEVIGMPAGMELLAFGAMLDADEGGLDRKTFAIAVLRFDIADDMGRLRHRREHQRPRLEQARN